MDKRITLVCISVGIIIISAVSGATILSSIGMSHRNDTSANSIENYTVASETVTMPVTSVTENFTAVSTSAVSTAVSSSAVTVTTVPVTTTAETSAVTVSVTSSVTTLAETTSGIVTTTQTLPPVTEPPQTAPPQTAPPETEAPPPPPETERQIIIPDSASEFQREVLRLVNEARAAEGKAGLSGNELLNRAADIRAEEISRFFDHMRPDGRDCFSVFGDVGFDGGMKGENIAAGTKLPSPADVVNEWMNSPMHRDNIMNGDFNYLGIGYFEADDEYRYYWVQLFAG